MQAMVTVITTAVPQKQANPQASLPARSVCLAAEYLLTFCHEMLSVLCHSHSSPPMGQHPSPQCHKVERFHKEMSPGWIYLGDTDWIQT